MYGSMMMLPYAWFNFWMGFWSGSKEPAKRYSDPIAAAGGGSASVVALKAGEKEFNPMADVTR